jgi:putative intracellular protease/amidase/catechol 2,3-dioxygenase-like lactoylglutathione lyase family enzyme
MPAKAVYLLVVPGFADWEPAHAVAELRRHGQYRVELVGLSAKPVQSMGGVTVHPTKWASEVDPADVAVFILPGGDRWEREPLEPDLRALLGSLDRYDVPIAAICAATTVIAREGLVRGRRHTSNGLDYLEHHVPGYSDRDAYVDAPAVRDRGLITASGLADVEFAAEIMTELGVLSAEDRSRWTRLFRSGRPTEAATRSAESEPILPAQDVARTREFYESLGFRAGYFDHRYEILRRGTLVVHLEAHDDLAPDANRTSCYWRVPDADALYQEFAALGLPDEGIPRLTAPFDEPWGMREFTIKDPAGNLIRVGHELRNS